MNNNRKYNNKFILKKLEEKKKKNMTKFYILIIALTIPILIYNFLKKEKDINTATLINKSTLDEKSNPTICLDAGHGDWDVGAEGITGSYEKDINLSVTLMIGEILKDYNLNVIYTRTTDTLFWSDNSVENLYERVSISNDNNSDIFISIHCNTSDFESYSGVETWYNPNNMESKLLSEIIQSELSNLNYTEDRGLKTYDPEESLVVLEHNSAVSTLIELGFISNYNDEYFLLSDYGQSLCAKAIADGILKYLEII